MNNETNNSTEDDTFRILRRIDFVYMIESVHSWLRNPKDKRTYGQVLIDNGWTEKEYVKERDYRGL